MSWMFLVCVDGYFYRKYDVVLGIDVFEFVKGKGNELVNEFLCFRCFGY